ncbi:MAG: transposase, partial [Tepidisphaeraceae bacterium]
AVEGGAIYHVLNRGNGRMRIFHKPEDYAAFVKLLLQARQRIMPVDVLGLCLMPNHWHLVLRPQADKDLAAFMRWLCTAHVRRHHAHYHSPPGHLYQGRYKSFPVQSDGHLLTVLRYVEANALRAGLAKRAGEWPWSSDAMRRGKLATALLSEWPVDRPRNWSKLLEEKMPDQDLDGVQTSVKRGRPYGSDDWTRQTAERLGLTFTLRPRGRPKAGEGG